MTPRSFLSFAFTFLIIAAAANARPSSLPPDAIRAMNYPSAVTLYSVHPDPRAAHWFNRKFRDYRILGQTPITAREERQRVASTIKKAVRDYAGVDTKCAFGPRHAVRFTRGDQIYDFLICYECQQLIVYRGDHSVFSQSIVGSSDILDTLLRRARIRIAE